MTFSKRGPDDLIPVRRGFGSNLACSLCQKHAGPRHKLSAVNRETTGSVPELVVEVAHDMRNYDHVNEKSPGWPPPFLKHRHKLPMPGRLCVSDPVD